MSKTFADTLLPAPRDGGFRHDGAWVWCGSVIKGDDGLFHMFASMWEKSVPFAPNWLTNSVVVHATSATPEGPYVYQGDVLPPRGAAYWDGMMTHNPTIHRCGDRYLLFYTGTTYQADRPTTEPVSRALRLEARSNQRIGMAVASSPNGPWTRPDVPCLDVRRDHWDSLMTTNPAPCVMPDGAIHLLYKSASSDAAPIQYGVARATSLEHAFERIGPDGPITFQDPSISYEDAYIWHQDGAFEMIFNDMTGKITGEDHAGAHATSSDGIEWSLCAQPKAYSRTVRWDDGAVTTQGSFERPQLLIQDGIPTHLFAATADGPGGFSRSENTWNMVMPIAPA
ncbi:MAG: glycoside hydrolase family protein [Planctomycetota bacterium]|jgi:hypothetical protein|nr:glycoside hydrolase family protein [Planctomycetota bacterium]